MAESSIPVPASGSTSQTVLVHADNQPITLQVKLKRPSDQTGSLSGITVRATQNGTTTSTTGNTAGSETIASVPIRSGIPLTLEAVAANGTVIGRKTNFIVSTNAYPIDLYVTTAQ